MSTSPIVTRTIRQRGEATETRGGSRHKATLSPTHKVAPARLGVWDGRQCEVPNAHSPVTPSTVTRHKHPVAAASSGKRCIRMHVGLTSTRLSPSPCFRPGQDMFRWGGNGSSSSTKTADSDSVPSLIVKKGGRGDGEGDGEGE